MSGAVSARTGAASATSTRHHVTCGGRRIDFRVERRARRTIEIAVEPDATVVVAAPVELCPCPMGPDTWGAWAPTAFGRPPSGSSSEAASESHRNDVTAWVHFSSGSAAAGVTRKRSLTKAHAARVPESGIVRMEKRNALLLSTWIAASGAPSSWVTSLQGGAARRRSSSSTPDPASWTKGPSACRVAVRRHGHSIHTVRHAAPPRREIRRAG